jgi:hypothetical protein
MRTIVSLSPFVEPVKSLHDIDYFGLSVEGYVVRQDLWANLETFHFDFALPRARRTRIAPPPAGSAPSSPNLYIMLKIIAWNLERREESWRFLVGTDADIALVQEATAPRR